MAWQAEPVAESSATFAQLQDVFRVTDASHLGVGRDVAHKEKHVGLTVVRGWRIRSDTRARKYGVAKDEVSEQAKQIRHFAGMPSIDTKLDAAAAGIPLDAAVNEKILLHGTKPQSLLVIMQNGLSERFSGGHFGQGLYLAEDPAKVDQYCTPDLPPAAGDDESIRALHDVLYASVKHPGRCFYAFVVRVVLGFPIYSKEGEKSMYPPHGAVFATADRRELAAIPGSNPPIFHHTLIVQVGKKADGFALERHREFVVCHSERVKEEFLIAYTRDTVVSPSPVPRGSEPAAATIGRPSEASVGFLAPAAGAAPPSASPAVAPDPAPAAVSAPATRPEAKAPEWAVRYVDTCKELAQWTTVVETSEGWKVLSARLARLQRVLTSAPIRPDDELLTEIGRELDRAKAVLKGTPSETKMKDCAQALQLLIEDLTLDMGFVADARFARAAAPSVASTPSLPSLGTTDTKKVDKARALQEYRQKMKQIRLARRGRATQHAAEEAKLDAQEGCWRLIPLFNRRVSIRTQLWIGMGLAVAVALAAFFAGSFGSLATLQTTTADDVQDGLESHAKSNILTFSMEMAAAINAKLRIPSDSIVMTLAEQAKVYLTASVRNGPDEVESIFQDFDSYAEFGFSSPCTGGSAPYGCPQDYGPLAGRSRLPYPIAGSVAQSSVQIFCNNPGDAGAPVLGMGPNGKVRGAAREPNAWSKYMSNRAVNGTVRALSIMDRDMQTLYQSGPDTTLQFYLAVKLTGQPDKSGSNYFSTRRTFPGYAVNDDTYDASGRSWFMKAPEDQVYMDGPYVETVTQKFVVTLSTKRTFQSTVINGYKDIVVVGGCVIMYSDLEQLTFDAQYLGSGFAVLAKYTGEVIAWGDSSANFQPYDTVNARFKKLTDADPALGSYMSEILAGPGTFRYTKQSPGKGQGEDWFVSHVPFYTSTVTDSTGASQTQATLVFLMFARRSEVLQTMPGLQTEMATTLNGIRITFVIIAAIIVVAVIVMLCLVDRVVAPPLQFLIKTSRKLVQAAAKDADDGQGRYLPIISEMPHMSAAKRAQEEMSEFGKLRVYFYVMMQRLGLVERAKLEKPRFPPNPFHQCQEAISAGRIGMILQQHMKDHGGKDTEDPLQREAKRMSAAAASDVISRDGGGSWTRRCVGRLKSLKFLTSTVALVLLAGLIIIAAISSHKLKTEGAAWMSETSDYIEAEQVVTLGRIAQVKSTFAATFFAKAAIDTLVVANFASELINGLLVPPTWRQSPTLPASYSLDCVCKNVNNMRLNSYAYQCTSPSMTCSVPADVAATFSGYFSKSGADCVNSPGRCQAVAQANVTQLTSVLDFKMRSTHHATSQVDFIQVGMEDTADVLGLTRVYSYGYKTYGYPSQCFVDANTDNLPPRYSDCRQQYQMCVQNTAGLPNAFPAYDPKCRSWYQLSILGEGGPGGIGGDPTKIYFQPPRTSSSGSLVVTAGTILTNSAARPYQAQGVLILNVKAVDLANSINNLRILQTGYSYVVDNTDPKNLILHPYLTSSCLSSGITFTPTPTECAERSAFPYSDAEWAAFSATVLAQVQTGALPYSGRYTRGGGEWYIAAAPLHEGTIKYAMLCTVPRDEVLQVVHDVEDKIRAAMNQQTTVFIVVIVIMVCFSAFLLWRLVRAISRPITQLIQVCQFIAEGDLAEANIPLPSSASSYEVYLLLQAFSSMLVALKFGSESFAKGDMQKALEAFQEAVDLFESICNDRGIGIAHNNVAAVKMALGNKNEAEASYMLSISLAQAMVEDLRYRGGEAPEKLKALAEAEKIYSNRLGNYAALLMEMEGSTAADPFEIAEQGQAIDWRVHNWYGWVAKQSLKGNFYVKSGEFKEAERTYRGCLTFLQDVRNDGHATMAAEPELQAAEQLARYNLAHWAAVRSTEAGADPAAKARAREMLADVLGVSLVHEVRTTTKALSLLRDLLDDAQQKADLDQLAKLHGLSISSSGKSSKKRVCFLLDYSGSMAGGKIRAARDAMVDMFDKHINMDDEVFLAHFSHLYCLDFDLSPKSVNTDDKRNKMLALIRPEGGTKFFGSVMAAVQRLERCEKGEFTNWIVALTDGDDNGSKGTESLPYLQGLLQQRADVLSGLIIVAVGDDIRLQPLEELAALTKHGSVVKADGSAESISLAFGQVAKLIESHVMIEDF